MPEPLRQNGNGDLEDVQNSGEDAITGTHPHPDESGAHRIGLEAEIAPREGDIERRQIRLGREEPADQASRRY
jgi:hypothetical protein